MCFSAIASLGAATVLGATGIATLALCPERRMRPYAAIPLLFALQQLAEGGLWIALAHGWTPFAAGMSRSFLVFSHVLWPAYVPLAVFVLEAPSWRKTALGTLSLAGALLGLLFLYQLLHDPVAILTTAGHIEYRMRYAFPAADISIYLAATVGGLLISSRPRLRLFGMLVLLSFLLAWWMYERWLVSVWCFFAALLSVVVLLQVRSARRDQDGRACPA